MGSAGTAAPTGGLGAAFGGLAAGGLLAGGGILGSLAGGKSPFGQLLGGLGGTLGAGFLGASGIFGSGVAAALPALLSNPITAIVAGALIGGALLVNFISGREQRKFRKDVENEYQVHVDGKEKGTALYQSIKALGETTFGKGKFSEHIVDTIRLDKGQEQIAAYAEATGQENNPLVKKFRDVKELVDPNAPRNQFVKRAFGGFVPFPDMGRDSVLTALRGQEFVTRPEIVRQQGVGAFEALNAGRAVIIAQSDAANVQRLATGGFVSQSNVRIFPTPITRASQSGGERNNNISNDLQRVSLDATLRLIQAIESFEGISDETIVRRAARKDPDTFAGAVHASMQRSSTPGLGIKNEVYKGR